MSINRVNISGNLTRDPEMRQTAGGTQILQFGVAVNDRRRNPQSGEWEDVPNYVDCVVFGGRAEPLSRFLSKGSKVAIEGKLRYSTWEQSYQQPSYQAPAPSYAAPAFQAPAPSATAPAVTPPPSDVYDEDIPF